jgi:hypothetical protein
MKLIARFTLAGLLAAVAVAGWAQVTVPKVALYPWTFAENERGTNPTALNTAQDFLRKLFEQRAGYEVVSEARARAGWRELGYEEAPVTVEELGQLPRMPSAEKLLALGKKLGVDYVCAGTLGWRVKSVWVALGPKTKAEATVNVMIVDVNKAEVALEVKDFNSGSSKAEKWYETAGSLLISMGFTVFSGGPKTPHMQKAAIRGLGASMEPYFATGPRKIKEDPR